MLIVGLPLLALVAGWLLAGREPRAIDRQPLDSSPAAVAWPLRVCGPESQSSASTAQRSWSRHSPSISR